jgi:pimeloyl-ACP methyl ester carboxylesterase
MAGADSPRRAPASPLDGARPFPEVAGVEVEHRMLEARGLRFHVAFAGPRGAEPLVLLHGWPQHWFEWRKVLPELSQHRRCVLPDLRGLGWSEAPRADYRKETLAQDVLAVLDALEIERTDLIAHDWGGWIGFLIALGAPERLHRYLALNIVPPWPPWPPGRPRVREALRLWRLWYQAVLATPLVGETLLRRTSAVGLVLRADNFHADAFSDEDIEAFAGPLREPARARASALIYRDFLLHEAPAIMRGRYEESKLTVPTQLLHGVRDWALGEGLSDAAAARAGGLLSLELVQDSGHFIAEERPDLVLARARGFLGVGGPPSARQQRSHETAA